MEVDPLGAILFSNVLCVHAPCERLCSPDKRKKPENFLCLFLDIVFILYSAAAHFTVAFSFHHEHLMRYCIFAVWQ